MSNGIIRLFIAVLLILAVMIVSGCAKEEAPAPTPAPVSSPAPTPTPTPSPATFSVSDLSIEPAEVTSGEKVTITVSVANTGGIEGGYTLVLKIDGVIEAEKSITVAAGNSQTVSFSVVEEKVGSYDVVVDGLSGSFTVAAPLPLQVRGWEGTTISRLCLKVKQSYPQIEGEFSEPIAEAAQRILERIRVQVVGEGEPCDATFTFTLNCRAEGAYYALPGLFLYTGATATGRLELALKGRVPLSLPVSESYPPPSIIWYYDDPPKNPWDAPFDEVWHPALLRGLSRLWGPWVLVEALHSEMESTAIDLLIEMKGEAVVEPLIQALMYENEYVRRQAAEALGEIGDARAVEPLIQALKDKDNDVRAEAAEALGEIRDDRAVGPLIEALKDEYWAVRKGAAEALGKIGDVRAVEPLTQALKDKDGLVQEAAEEALEKIRGY